MPTLLSTPYIFESSYRHFTKNERHITRYASHFVLLFVLDGSLYFDENGVPIRLHKGQWYIQQPHMLQEGSLPSDEPYYYYIHFNVPSEIQSPKHLSLPVQGTFNPSGMIPYFEALEASKSYSNAYLLDFQLTFLKILKQLVLTSKPTLSPQRQLTEAVMHYIEHNPTASALPQALEEHFNFSYTTLSKLTKKHFHTTPVQYMTHLRLSKAQHLLATTDYTIEHIAQLVGYNDLSVFFKAFKKAYDLAPGTFRQQVRYES